VGGGGAGVRAGLAVFRVVAQGVADAGQGGGQVADGGAAPSLAGPGWRVVCGQPGGPKAAGVMLKAAQYSRR
jgi:hypothetical protein